MATAQADPIRSSNVAMQGLYEVTKLLTNSPRPRESLPRVLGVLCDFFELTNAAVAFVQPDDASALFVAQTGIRPRITILVHEALKRTRITRSPWILESQWDDASLRDHREVCGDTVLDLSFVSVPITVDEQLRGVVCIERTHGPSNDQACFCFDNDVQMLRTIAMVLVTLERIRGRAANETGGTSAPPSREPSSAEGPSEAIGKSPCWRNALARARAAAKHNTTVLLRGESGSGKDVFARAIHRASPRRDEAFVAVNCAALSETVLESELFGHEKGAFTGAIARRKGRFELADRGTLFLDEIGEISATFQARLLRVLQLGEFERVGGMETLRVDVRLIAATNRNLEEDVRLGRFRTDLYYRLSVIPLMVPPLRARRADIPLLAEEFLRRFNAQNGTSLRLDGSALEVLMAYEFPGNVRELENGVCRAATFAQAPILSADDFDWLRGPSRIELGELDTSSALTSSARTEPLGRISHDSYPAYDSDPSHDSYPSHDSNPSHDSRRSYRPHEPERGSGLECSDDATSRARIVAALERSGWVQAKAARLLGVTARQLGYAVHKHGIPVRKF